MKISTKLSALIMVFSLLFALLPMTETDAASYTKVDAGYSVEEATEISVGEVYVTAIGEGKGKNHWFKFTTAEEDAYYYLETKNIDVKAHSWSYDYMAAEICTEFGEVIFANKHISSTNPKISNYKLDANTTYYFRVHENWFGTGGNFKFQITKQDDPDKNDRDEATEIQLNTQYDKTIDGNGDVDWFKFTTGDRKAYILNGKNLSVNTHSWSADLYFRLTLYNEVREELTRVRLAYGKSGSSVIFLEPNTVYYVKAENHLGGADYYGKDNTYLFSVTMPACGDVNADGVIDASDALLVLKHCAKLETLDELGLSNADTDDNKQIEANDALCILKYAASLISKLPV